MSVSSEARCSSAEPTLKSRVASRLRRHAVRFGPSPVWAIFGGQNAWASLELYRATGAPPVTLERYGRDHLLHPPFRSLADAFRTQLQAGVFRTDPRTSVTAEGYAVARRRRTDDSPTGRRRRSARARAATGPWYVVVARAPVRGGFGGAAHPGAGGAAISGPQPLPAPTTCKVLFVLRRSYIPPISYSRCGEGGACQPRGSPIAMPHWARTFTEHLHCASTALRRPVRAQAPSPRPAEACSRRGRRAAPASPGWPGCPAAPWSRG